jgi:hypothetical protein
VSVPEPRIKRYALVPTAGEDGVRRYSLARVASVAPYPERLERMEEIAARDRERERPGGEDGREPPG